MPCSGQRRMRGDSSALEVWYLGVPCVKSIDVPGLKELKALEGDLSALHARLHGPSRNIDDHPPEPAPLRAYLPGGVPDGEGTGSVCDMCPWMTICEGPSDVTLDDGGLQHGPGEAEAIECTPDRLVETEVRGGWHLAQHAQAKTVP